MPIFLCGLMIFRFRNTNEEIKVLFIENIKIRFIKYDQRQKNNNRTTSL